MLIATISKSRRLFTAILAAACAATMMIPTFAFGITADEAVNQDIEWAEAQSNSGNTQYLLQLEEAELAAMSIDVPIQVVLAVDDDGNFMTPTALKNVIENDSEFPVNVVAMDITAKDDFALKAGTGFDFLIDSNIFTGSISSVALAEDGQSVGAVKQNIAFTKLASDFVKNLAWSMQASDANGDPDANEKTGDDCLYIQIAGEIDNVKGHYFTAPINVFDITYTFEATSADLAVAAGDIAD